jgi:hypothetical protein
MHAQEKQQGRGRGGVVIALLSKKARKAWDKAGNMIIKPDVVAINGTVRMMSINIVVPLNNTWETLSIFNVYAPPPPHQTMMKTINASIGNCPKKGMSFRTLLSHQPETNSQ